MSDDAITRAYRLLGGMYEALQGVAPWVPYDGCRGERSYRTGPVPGAVLGGEPRNPEDDVVDEIDRLVNWQLENGRGR
jgi:hypothetical protein